MKKAIIGRKLGMTHFFTEVGDFVPITVVEASGCIVVGKKTVEKNGYDAVQLGFEVVKFKNIKKPLAGFFKKNGLEPRKVIGEFRFSDCSKFNIGENVKSDVFSIGEKVDVTAISKGKGWAGVIKRWNFHRLRETHGTGPVGRHGGSIGQCAKPSRVFKGKKMSGHLGNERVTVQNLKIVKIDSDRNLLAIRGSVPGPAGCVVYVKDAIKSK